MLTYPELTAPRFYPVLILPLMSLWQRDNCEIFRRSSAVEDTSAERSSTSGYPTRYSRRTLRSTLRSATSSPSNSGPLSRLARAARRHTGILSGSIHELLLWGHQVGSFGFLTISFRSSEGSSRSDAWTATFSENKLPAVRADTGRAGSETTFFWSSQSSIIWHLFSDRNRGWYGPSWDVCLRKWRFEQHRLSNSNIV